MSPAESVSSQRMSLVRWDLSCQLDMCQSRRGQNQDPSSQRVHQWAECLQVAVSKFVATLHHHGRGCATSSADLTKSSARIICIKQTNPIFGGWTTLTWHEYCLCMTSICQAQAQQSRNWNSLEAPFSFARYSTEGSAYTIVFKYHLCFGLWYLTNATLRHATCCSVQIHQ